MAKHFKSHQPKTAGSPRRAVRPPAEKPIDRGKLEAAWRERAEASQGGKKPRNEPVWPKEIGGPSGPEPTRYGDWERNGICSDF
jgi:hypothetical protein